MLSPTIRRTAGCTWVHSSSHKTTRPHTIPYHTPHTIPTQKRKFMAAYHATMVRVDGDGSSSVRISRHPTSALVVVGAVAAAGRLRRTGGLYAPSRSRPGNFGCFCFWPFLALLLLLRVPLWWFLEADNVKLCIADAHRTRHGILPQPEPWAASVWTHQPCIVVKMVLGHNHICPRYVLFFSIFPERDRCQGRGHHTHKHKHTVAQPSANPKCAWSST